MKWYSGGIAEAITYSKSRGSVFVVYIEGTDEISQKITELIDNGELGHKLEQDCFVAIKLQGGSIEHQQFSEIYKGPTIPSIYLIGKNGVPLDIITGKDNLDNICQKIDNTLSKAGVNVHHISGVSGSVSSDNFIKNELAAADNPKVVCDTEVCKIVDNKSPEDDSAKTINSEVLLNKEKENSNNDEMLKENIEEKEDESQLVKLVEEKKEEEKKDEIPDDSLDLSADEKVQRAKELLELRRQQKEQEEKESERQKELERRKMGANVQQLKKWQEDQEMKQLKEEREREKRENQQARERVLAQIAQDRAERLSRSQSSSPPSAPESSKSAPQSQSPPKVTSNTTRLQFKLPDGSSSTHEFENSDTLDIVICYIKSNLPLPFSNFTLSTVFPRREFTKNDYSQTLVDLQLSPTAVILILPQNSGPVASNPGGSLTALIYSLLSPIFGLFDYLKSLVFGTPSSSGRPQKRPPPDEPMESQRFSNSKRKVTDPSTVVRRQGNIHRLSDTNDSDDENNTWNGNSTQQM